MSALDIGEKPLAQWTMSTGSHGTPATDKMGAFVYTSEVSSLKQEKTQKFRPFAWWKMNSVPKCTLESVHKHGWRPETMRAPVLVTFALVSVLLAVLIEVLAQQSQRAGGLSLVEDADSLPTGVAFGYLYLPTIVAVIYNLAWNWIDLDVKRMQPWLELSRPQGATGHNSLFLDYPFDFVAFVPFKAAKRRHWAVFFSGTVMVLIFLAITPLQSATIGTSEVLVTKPISIKMTSEMMDLATQTINLDPNVLNTGYAITWLNQTYPAFTTAKYALKPFQPEASSMTLQSAANWTGTTTKYWTDLNCWPAEIKRAPVRALGTTSFFNGRSCNATGIVAHRELVGSAPYMMRYIGYQNSAWADYCLAGPNCSSDASNQFLATWGHFDNATDEIQISATFCETSYFKQEVKASVTSQTFSPIDLSIEPLSSPEPLTMSEFNISALEYLMQGGVASEKVPREYPFTHLVEHYPRLNYTGLAFPLSPMIGFALGGQNYTVPQYSDEKLMADAFHDAHQLIFALAIQHMYTNSTTAKSTNQNSTDGHISFVKYGVVVSRLYSAILEAFLLLVAVLVLMLAWTCYQSSMMLSEDPSSLGSLINVIKNSESLLEKFSGKGNLSDEQLVELLAHHTFQLSCGCQDNSGTTKLQIISTTDSPKTGPSQETEVGKPLPGHSGHYSPIKPFALRKGSGAFFAACLCAAIVVLVCLKEQEKKLGGLIRPSSSLEVNLLLTSLIPTAFSTLVEPFWVLLNRLICVFQPFEDLRCRERNAEGSLRVRYTAVPPQLAFVRAIKSGHFLLATLCVIALLANVLSVGLGGLFNESPKEVVYPLTVTPTKAARFTEQGLRDFATDISFGHSALYEDPFYVANANLTSNNPLIPWTTKDYVFLPVNLTSDARTQAVSYNATTIGIGIVPSCVAIGPVLSTDEPPILDTSFGRPSGPPKGCARTYQPSGLLFNTTDYKIPEGRSSAEITSTMTPDYNITDCDKSFIFGWSRSDIKNRTGEMKSSFVVCHPQLTTANFQISFDAEGRILSSKPVSDFKDSLDYPNATTHFDKLINDLNHRFRSQGFPWHNDTVSYDSFNYLFKIRSGDDALLDPATPVPDPAVMLPVVTDIYRLTFALFLGLNRYVFEDLESPQTLSGYQSITETRIFMSTSAFIICVTVLSLNLLAAAAMYGWSITFFLPRMPTTIASLVAYVAPSRVVREYSRGNLENTRTFGFGRYMGDDGCAQIGIEFAERVIPVKVSSLERGNTMPASTKFGRLIHRPRVKKQGDTWI